jgi:hypothetical protein
MLLLRKIFFVSPDFRLKTLVQRSTNSSEAIHPTLGDTFWENGSPRFSQTHAIDGTD